MTVLGFYEGRIIDIDTPVISLEDRGYQFGDGVYEVAVSYNGKYFALQEHLDRMERSCRELEIVLPYNREEMEDICHRMLSAAKIKEAMLYLQLTRGRSPRAHTFPDGVKPILTGTIRPRKVLDPELFTTGVKAITVPDLRWLRCDIKSLNLLGNIMARQKAGKAGAFEAILIRDEKLVTEGSACNSFAVKDGAIYTAPLCNLILGGITRNIVVDLIRQLGLDLKEEFVSPAFYREADEVFLTGTTTEVMPVVSLDEQPIANGKVGPVTRQVQKAFFEVIGKLA